MNADQFRCLKRMGVDLFRLRQKGDVMPGAERAPIALFYCPRELDDSELQLLSAILKAIKLDHESCLVTHSTQRFFSVLRQPQLKLALIAGNKLPLPPAPGVTLIHCPLLSELLVDQQAKRTLWHQLQECQW